MSPSFLGTQIASMLSNTDILSKIIIAILTVFSMASWTIIFGKSFKISAINSKIDKFLKVFWSGENVYDIYKKYKDDTSCPMACVFVEIMKDIDGVAKTKEIVNVEYAIEKIYDAMSVTISKKMQNIRHGMQFMNVVATSSTYFGLLGTVCGISQSFRMASFMKEATIASLAPGISTALITTIFGLISAIPALVSYQLISHKINLIEENLNNFSIEFAGIVSKELEKDDD